MRAKCQFYYPALTNLRTSFYHHIAMKTEALVHSLVRKALSMIFEDYELYSEFWQPSPRRVCFYGQWTWKYLFDLPLKTIFHEESCMIKWHNIRSKASSKTLGEIKHKSFLIFFSSFLLKTVRMVWASIVHIVWDSKISSYRSIHLLPNSNVCMFLKLCMSLSMTFPKLSWTYNYLHW
jgi:hypothetical protein